MNALGVQVEQARLTPVMSRLHPCFSLGNLAGAASVILVARLSGAAGSGVVTPALVTLRAVAAVCGIGIAGSIPPAAAVPVVRAPAGGLHLPAGVLPLGAMAFSFGLVEGTAVDWSSVHVSDVARVEPATGALGLVAVSLFMVLIRLFGVRAVARFGRVNVVRVGALVAAAGYVVTILGQPLPVLLVGWALVGLGVGLIAPQVYAVAGHTGGARMLAVVVTFGYGAFLIGPAIIGALVARIGIGHAMTLPLVLSLVLVALSRVLSRGESAGRSRHTEAARRGRSVSASWSWEDGERPASGAAPMLSRIPR